MSKAKAKPRKKPYRVAVSVPAGDHVYTNFCFDFVNMVAATVLTRDDVDIRTHVAKGTILPKSRQDLVYQALEADYTHILFLDSDMRFPRYTLLQLLSHGEPIVGCNYPTRQPPVRPVTFRSDDNALDRVYTEAGQTGLEEVAAIGFGCVLIDLDVFRALDRPWFMLGFEKQEGGGARWVGEDVYFCLKARNDLGLKILIDHDLSQKISHIGVFEYNLEHAREVRDSTPVADQAVPVEAPSGNILVH